MTPALKSLFAFCAICVLAAAVHAADGILIVEKTTVGEQSQTHQVQIEKTRMRAESTTPSGEKRIALFDGSKQILRLLNYDKKTYSELTKADVERIGGQISNAMSQLQDQLKGMPPEQRAQIEKMMQGRGMAAAADAAKPDYRKAGTDQVGSWTCTKYEGFTHDQKTSEICAVDPSALGLSAADFEVTQQLADFFQKLMPQGADRVFSIGSRAAQGFDGVPVRRISLGPPRIASEVVRVERQGFAASTFELPAGFQKQEFGRPPAAP